MKKLKGKENEPISLNEGDKVMLSTGDETDASIVMTVAKAEKPKQIGKVGKLVLTKCTITLKRDSHTKS